LIMRDAREVNHQAEEATIAESRSECFILGARNLAKYIGKLCIKCCVLTKKRQTQMMPEIPDQLQVPAPPFTHLRLDLFGPLEVQDDVRAQSTRYVRAYKTMWVAVVVCLGTYAAKLYLMWGYSTEYFMFTWEHHKSDWGIPITVCTDKGMQLVQASQVISNNLPVLDWAKFAESQGVIWWSCPAEAQFRNGAYEVVVKKAKRTLQHIYGDARLSTPELETALKCVA